VYPDEIQSGTNVPCATSASKTPRAGVTKVELASCLGYARQNWTVQANGELQVFGLCLDTVGESTTAGTLVDLNTCTGAPTQLWTPQANRELTNGGAPGICLDDPASNTANGTDLDIATCSGGNNQQWRLPAV
jgi:Ricin-type beta-trefoil lectin domain